jgi:hypothetical protein
MIRYSKSVIDWFLEQQLLSLDPVNNCILFHDIVRRLLLFNANSAIFQLYQDENKLILNEIMMRSTLYYTNTLSCIFTVLAHWNNSPWIDMSFQASQCLFFLLKAMCLAVMQHIPISLSLVWPTAYHTWVEHANHYTIDVVVPWYNIYPWLHMLVSWIFDESRISEKTNFDLQIFMRHSKRGVWIIWMQINKNQMKIKNIQYTIQL